MKGATIVLPNGHLVERLLFEKVCLTIKCLASKNLSTGSSSRLWVGQQALREFWVQCVNSNNQISRSSRTLLSSYGLCNDNSSTTENIRNIILSLTLIDNAGDIIMTVPPIEERGSNVDPLPVKTKLNLGKAPIF
jgi:hypothetical protein